MCGSMWEQKNSYKSSVFNSLKFHERTWHYYSLSCFLWHGSTRNTTTHRASQKHKFLCGLSVLSCTLVDKNKRPDQAGLISPASASSDHAHKYTMAATLGQAESRSSSSSRSRQTLGNGCYLLSLCIWRSVFS